MTKNEIRAAIMSLKEPGTPIAAVELATFIVDGFGRLVNALEEIVKRGRKGI